MPESLPTLINPVDINGSLISTRGNISTPGLPDLSSIPPERRIAFLRALCDRSFYWFVKIIGGSVGQGGVIIPEIHGVLCNFYQDDSIKRKCIFMPRNQLKSTLFTEWGSIWRYLQDNNARTLIASQNEDIAARFIFFIQNQILNNRLLRKVYPELQKVDENWRRSHRWSSEMMDLPRTIEYKEASITSVGVTSAAQSGHYSIVLADDPVGQKHMDSPTEMERIYRWHDNTKELLENPNYLSPDGGLQLVVCTHWGMGDYGSYIRDKYPEYHWRIVPALKDEALVDEENLKWVQNPHAEHDTSNWEGAPGGRSSTAYYHDMRANAEQNVIFWTQHQNNPQAATATTKFDPGWLRFYHFEDRSDGKYIVCDDDKEEFRIGSFPLFGMIDPGGFAEMRVIKKGSRNAIIIGGQPTESIKKFIVYQWAGRFKDPDKFMDEIFKAHAAMPARLWRVDTAAQQKYIYRDIQLECKKRGKHLTLIEMMPDGRKDTKDSDIQALIGPMSNGEIYVHRLMRDLITEIRQYPNGLTVDLLDMVGKLGKHHFRRKKMIVQKADPDIVNDGRSELTGY